MAGRRWAVKKMRFFVGFGALALGGAGVLVVACGGDDAAAPFGNVTADVVYPMHEPAYFRGSRA